MEALPKNSTQANVSAEGTKEAAMDLQSSKTKESNQLPNSQAHKVGPVAGLAAKPSTKSKYNKRKQLSQEQQAAVETQLLSDIAATMSKSERETIYKQSQDLLTRISDKEQVLSMEEILQIVKDWKPKQEILCLYVRIARKLPANFHLDSISTLLCISKQCGYTPINFLTKTKCLQITPSGGRYGFSFMFKTISNKTMDGEALDRKFVGLSLTLTLLEHSIANSCAVISRDGMRSSVPRESVNKAIDLGGSSKTLFKTMPTNEFHKRTSLINRLWLAINHRWMSYHLVEHLFVCKNNLCGKDSILVYSFMMHASCGKSRYQFLDPIVGVCFRFITLDDIEANRSRLDDLWKQPSNFLTFGNNCLQQYNNERKIRILADTFTSMKSLFTRTSSYGRAIDNNRKWLMLRAYIFSFWLKRESNAGIRSQLECLLASKPVTSLSKSQTATNGTRSKNFATSNIHQINTTKKVPDSFCKRRRLDGASINCRLWSPVYDESTRCASTVLQVNNPTLNQIAKTTEKRMEGHGKSKPAPTNMQQVTQPSPNKGDERTENGTEHGSSLHFCPVSTRAKLLSKDWSSIHLLSQEELDKVTASCLVIHTDSGLDIMSRLSPLEVYSADRLKDFRHSRIGGPPGYQPLLQLGEVVLHVGSGTDEYLDKHSKLFHVVRKSSVYFKEYYMILPSDLEFANLCKSILKYGNIDHERSNYQYRVNIGCGGQHFPGGVPATLIGKSFAKKLEKDNIFDTTEILSTIGLIVEFLWRVSQDIQRDVHDAPLAPDPVRWNSYAKHLCSYLFINHDVGFEDITLVLSPITGKNGDVVSEHTDSMNDNLGGYSRTCAFNACFSLDNDTFMHMQVIGNFRRVVRQYMVPFEKSLQSTIANGRRYVASWRSNMQLIFAGVSCNNEWDPFSRSQFFLDDDLPFERLRIFDGLSKDNKQSAVYGHYLLTEIGLSRVTSFSMFIDPICRLKDKLSTDQRIELAFFCSFLSNPFWFHYVMEKLIDMSNQSNNVFPFGIHPMYNVVKELYATFGTWQGGPHNRWSPCGGAVPVVQLFGAHPSATCEEKQVGTEKLEAIVEVLFCHLEWVNSLHGKGSDPLIDLPLSTIQLHWESVRQQIYEIVPCQFSLFRISVFTTIAIGCNELLHGPHLKQIMIPFPGTSSFKHLLAPSKGQMSQKSATDLATNTNKVIIQPNEDDRVAVGDHDRLMLYLSNSVGRNKYVRDEMECLLCESHPGRSLECRDWFCKGQDIFDCSDDGVILKRKYGKESDWEVVDPPQTWSFQFLKRPSTHFHVDQSTPEKSIHYKVNKSVGCYAHSFGIELRQSQETIVFNGRNTTKSNRQSEFYDNPFLHRSTSRNRCNLHHYRSANLFSSSYCKAAKKYRMVVLGNGETPKKMSSECNEFESFPNGMPLLDIVREILPLPCGTAANHDSMVAGCYHQEIDDSSDTISYFPAHLDKCYIHNAWFVPLTDRLFFTFVAVPSSWKVQQDVDSNQEYQSWLRVISNDEQQSMWEFHDLFKRDACKFMNLSSVTSLVFSNKLGSVLQFPPNRCFHATIIPPFRQKATTKLYRDLLIIHPLVTI